MNKQCCKNYSFGFGKRVLMGVFLSQRCNNCGKQAHLNRVILLAIYIFSYVVEIIAILNHVDDGIRMLILFGLSCIFAIYVFKSKPIY